MSAHRALISLTPKPPSTAHAFDLENGTGSQLKTGHIHCLRLQLHVHAHAHVCVSNMQFKL